MTDKENAFQWEMRMLGNIHHEREMEAAKQFAKDCEFAGRKAAAEIIATERGYTGREAEIFMLGFRGYSAKYVNPRSEGLEHLFREGRKAWQTSEGQRLARIKTSEARETAEAEPTPFHPGGLITNGEYDA